MQSNEKITLLLEITQYLAQIRAELSRIRIEHQQILQDLINHRLSEGLLPKTLFAEISVHIHELGLTPLSLDWMYIHAQTEFLFHEDGQLVYVIHVPFVEKMPY